MESIQNEISERVAIIDGPMLGFLPQILRYIAEQIITSAVGLFVNPVGDMGNVYRFALGSEFVDFRRYFRLTLPTKECAPHADSAFNLLPAGCA